MRTGRSWPAFALIVAACSAQHGPRASVERLAVPLIAAEAYAATSAVEVMPPWSLATTDGSALVLTRVDAKAVVEGPLAFTELHLYFRNDDARIREGTFQITLPPHAAISRFAMENNGSWMEAEVVPKDKARVVYEDFLHRRQDPALLEKAAGNQFSARVFPIAARSEKHLVISYSQELSDPHYVLPLRGLPRTARVDVSLQAAGQATRSLAERDWEPDRDFVASVEGNAVSAGDLVAARIEITGATSVDTPAAVTLLVDTSASRALGYARYVDRVKEVVDGIAATYGASVRLQVVAFDQDAELIYVGPARSFEREKLLERGAAGASDLGQAFEFVAAHAPHARLVLVTDGVITAGAEAAELAARMKRLADAKVERLDVIVSGGLRDEAAMQALVRGLPRAGAVLDLDREPVVAALGQAVLLDVPVQVAGARWVFPRMLASARAGSHAVVFARLAKPRTAVEINVGGAATTHEAPAGTGPLVERAFARAEIEDLEAMANAAGPDDARTLRATIADKSVRSRVLSTQTALLVLETEQDYERYGIERRALADILVVGPRGVERQGRKDAVILAQGREVGPSVRSSPLVELSDDSTDAAQTTADRRLAAEQLARARTEQSRAVERLAEARAAAARAERLKAVSISRECLDNPLGCEGQGRRRNSLPGDVAVRHRRTSSDDSPHETAPAPEQWPPKDAQPALTGELAEITILLKRDIDRALDKARGWHARDPGNVVALVALGEALEANGSTITAARVYGSIIDLYPGRADLRRFAGERLSRLKSHDLVVDTFKRAVADRPDHLTGHRLLAYALVRAGKHADAFAAILASLDQSYRATSFAGGHHVLSDDASMIGAAYAAAVPAKHADIAKALATRKLVIATKPSTRFVLYWETDTNDVDLHVHDAKGNHAYYGQPAMPSGGELYADVRTGYGPECFTIDGMPKAGPYRLSLHYYAQGPMGYGMGLLQIQRFDGKGGLTFEDRPYVIMNERAYLDLGAVR